MKSSEDGVTTSVGEIAERFGLATHVLRHWESAGLLSPSRDIAGRRRSYPHGIYRVAVILGAKQAGIALDGIREIICAQDPRTRHDGLRRHRAELLRHIAESQSSLDLVECVLDCDHEDCTQCAHFQAAVAERIGIDLPTHARL